MNDLVGIIRTASEVEEALGRLQDLKARAESGLRRGTPAVQPGLAPRPGPATTCCSSPSAWRRPRWNVRSPGAATPATTSPAMNPEWRKVNLVCSLDGRRLGQRRASADPTDARSTCSSCSSETSCRSTSRLPSSSRCTPTVTRFSSRRRRALMGYTGHFRVWRGDDTGGALKDFDVEVNEGEVVLDVIHRLQATEAPDLAVRWNCKAGKCGSCSAEVNGRPRLMCMTRMSTFTEDETVTVTPMRAFPVIRDLVTDVSFNYEKARAVPAFAPPADLEPGDYRMQQVDVERSQEFRKCIECFLCQDTCHVIRDHEDNKPAFSGPAVPHADRRAGHAPAGHRRPGQGRRRTSTGSASATSPSAAPRSARSTSTSPTTRSSR